MENKISLKSSLILLLTATIWGVAFVAQTVGMDYVGPYTFNSVRSIIGSIVLLPVIFVMDRNKPVKKLTAEEKKTQKKTLLIGGVCCGVALCLASNLQQIGINCGTPAGKAGFITACYIVIVPILGLFFKKKCTPLIWAAVALSLIGLYLLCMNPSEGFSIGLGEFYLVLCAILFSIHILVIDHFSPMTDGVKLSCIQFFVSGVLSGIPALLTESPQASAILSAWMPILYAGVLSCGVAYTLQIIGQKNMNPTVASLILSLESCISVLAGWIILHQNLSLKEILGCVIMFAAIILAQMPTKK